MAQEVEWGILLVGAFISGGLGAGTYLTGLVADTRGGEKYEKISRFATHLSWILVGISIILLSLDLGRPLGSPADLLHAPIEVIKNIETSMISIGGILLAVFFILSLLTSLMWRGGWERIWIRNAVWVIGGILAILVLFYPWFVLSFSIGNIFWRSPFLPWLFAASHLLGGLYLVGTVETDLGRLFSRFRIGDGEALGLIGRYGKILAVVVIIFLVGHLIYASIYESMVLGQAYGTMELLAGRASIIFWVFAVILGLIVPLILSFYLTRYPVALLAFTLRIIGVFTLVWAILLAGQLAPTFPTF